MADYSAFDKGIVPWLQKVWTDRQQIQLGVRQRNRAEGAWLIYDRYNDPTESGDETKAWALFRDDLYRLRDEYGITPSGQSCGDAWQPNDFYHFIGGCRPGKGLWRIYAHVKEPREYHWTPTAVYCLHMITSLKQEVIEKFKVAGPGLSPNRGDQIVIWVNSEDAKNSTLESLKGRAGEYGGSVPPGVKEVVPGLGWSKEPTAAEHGSPAVDEVYRNDRHSFGSFLAGVIYMALEQSWGKTEDDYVKELVEFFLNVGINPANPQLLRSISWEELKLRAGVGNGNVVRTGLVKPTTVFTDQTKVITL